MNAFTHAERARILVNQRRQGTLCTLVPSLAEPALAGYPYGSVVSYALDPAGHPLLLTSTMAEHTHNFKTDARASLFVLEESETDDPLAVGRVTLLGRVEEVGDDELTAARESYLSRHPDAVRYVEYRDFAFYRLRVEAIRYIGGFGHMSWVDVNEYRQAMAYPIVPPARDSLQQASREPERAP